MVSPTLDEGASAKGQARFASRRAKAKNLFFGVPYPGVKDEGWRHIHLNNYETAHRSLKVPKYRISGLGPKDETHLQLRSIDAPAYTTLFNKSDHKLQLLHQAFWEKGLVVTIPPRYHLAQPIITTAACPGPGTSLPYIVVDIMEDSQATVIVRFAKAKTLSLVSSQILAIVRPGAKLTITSEIVGQTAHDHFHKTTIIAYSNSSVVHVPILHGDGLLRTDLEMIMSGVGSAAKLAGLSIGSGNAQLITDTVQNHLAADTTTDFNYRSVLSGHSRTVYHGLIQIKKGADRSDAYQKNMNVLLNDTVRAHTSPKLEIEANEVRCTHGATSGPLDKEQIFAILSRGIDQKSAQKLLLDGFVMPLFSDVENAAARRFVRKIVMRAIEQLADENTS